MNSSIPYKSPEFMSDGFNCPFCLAYANQAWGQPLRLAGGNNYGADESFWICRCGRCSAFSIWLSGNLIHPPSLTAPPPNPDLSEEIKKDYDEARGILTRSPRGSAALLRLAIQKLCKELGEKGGNVNDDIAALVRKGLPVPIQQALDIVRVVGNNAVHPGQIDLRDDVTVANRLFGLVNLIAEVMITQPKHVKSLYDSIVPESQRTAIAKRDKGARGGASA
jgi:hypothetical protein